MALIPNASIDILDNGIKVVIEEIPHLRSASLGLLIGSGSSSEEKAIMGLSHFIEHMTFKGTPKRTSFQIAQALDAIGGRLNAFTGKEYTVFYAVVEDKHFDIASDVLSDILLNSLHDPKEIEMEKNVVLEEIRMYEDTPDEQIHDLFASTILRNHGLGNITLGTEDTVRTFDRGKILTYMDSHYTPDNLIISVAGNISKDIVLKTFSGIFKGRAGKKTNGLSPVPAIIPAIKLKKKKTEQAHIVLGSKGCSQMDDDRYAFTLLDNILGGSMSSRLFQEVREKRGLAYSIYSFNQGFRNIGLFGVYAGTKKENTGQVVDLILKELSDIKKNGIKPDELSRAKEYIKGTMVLSLESSNSRMNYIAKSVYYYDKIVSVDDVIAKIDRVTNDDIIRLAGRHFSDDLMNLVVIADMDELPVKRIKI